MKQWSDDRAKNLKPEKELSNPTVEAGDEGCFITTACVQSKGLADDCVELTTLRKFRDDYVVVQPGGAALVELYYNVSPSIVTAIGQRCDQQDIYDRLFVIIRECVEAIEQGHAHHAMTVYVGMMLVLKAEFCPDVIEQMPV